MKRLPDDWQLTLILDQLRSAYNVGNVFRIAEALHCRIMACGCTPCPPHPVLVKTAMGTDRMVECESFPDAVQAIKAVRKAGAVQVLALEDIPGTSCDVWEWKKFSMPMALVLGNEALGVSKEALALCDGAVGLPMFGQKSSINVGNAAAGVLYGILAACAKVGRE